MTGLVTLIVLAAAAMHAAWSALVKEQTDRLAGMAVMSGVGSLAGAALIWLEPPLQAAAVGWLAASIVLHWIYFGVLVEAYRIGDLSQVYPVSRGVSPLGIALFGTLSGSEALTPLVLLGVGAVSAGLFSLALPGEGRPTPAGSGSPPRRAHGMALAYALVVGGLIVAYSLVDSRGVRAGQHPLAYAGWLFAFQSVPWLLLAGVRRGRALLRTPQPVLLRALGAGVLSVAAYGAVLWAFSQGSAAAVSALRETGVIFAALIGTLFLGEPFGARRVAAAALVALGVALIRLG